MKRRIESPRGANTNSIAVNKKIIWLNIALIIFLGFAVYGNSLNGAFIWDDNDLIGNNVYIKDWSHIPDILTKNIAAGADEKYFSYRPLQMITYMANYSIWGLNATGYHFTNIILHILAVLAICWLVNLVFRDSILALLTSILFLAHPAHVAVVTYISGRADSLALLFMLLCFIFYIKSIDTERIGSFILVSLSYALALLSRESSLILPALVLLYHYAFNKKIKFKYLLPILSVFLIYILIRLTILKALVPHISSPTTLFQRIPGFLVALTNYAKILLFPVNLHMEYGPKLFTLRNPAAIFGMVVLVFLLIYALKKRKSNKLIFFSVSWFFVALFPLSNLYPIPIAYMAEHWLYVPSIGFFLVLSQGLCWLYYRGNARKAVSILLAALILFFYSRATFRYNEYWKEPVTFYEKTLQRVPDSLRTLNSLAMEYWNQGKKEEAIALLKKAINISWKDKKAYNNLGVIYEKLNMPQEAAALYSKVIEMNPADAKAYNNLGNAYSASGRIEEAIAAYKKSLSINPNSATTYSNLGVLHGNSGRYDEAIGLYMKAIKINPYFAGVYFNLSIAYFYKNDYNSAIKYCDLAIKYGANIDPKYIDELKPFRK